MSNQTLSKSTKLVDHGAEERARASIDEYGNIDIHTWSVCIDECEYLPGQRFMGTPLSRTFYDERLAEASLEQVIRRFPDAVIFAGTWYLSLNKPEDMVKFRKEDRHRWYDQRLADELDTRTSMGFSQTYAEAKQVVSGELDEMYSIRKEIREKQQAAVDRESEAAA
jgi:hypothetical protein